MRPAIGIFLLVGASYALAGPGRIDIIDGQYRFEVAKNLLEHGSIQVMDPVLGFAVPGILGAYSPYGISGSIVSLPLVALGRIGSPSLDREQFFFSFTSAAFGAATAALLFLFYLQLAVPRRTALGWTLISSFATLAFPVATSVFDQSQQGFFVLAACLLAFLAGRRDSIVLAAAGGVAAAVLVNFQQTYAVLLPTLALAALAVPAANPGRRSLERYLVFVFTGALGLLFWAALNNFRFGTLLFIPGQGTVHPSAVGNPLIGLPGLLVSPGKSIFLYSPPTVIALFGLREVLRRERRLGQAVIASSLVYLAMISSLSFYGGDWCWGPRYFVSILPLLALGFPFVKVATTGRRFALRTLVAAGLLVQSLAISVDHHRFFYARALPTFFWYSNPSYYFSHSALLARPGEVWDMLAHGVPPEAVTFRPGPYSKLLTYAVFGGWGHPQGSVPAWMRQYSVFWLPRPWPMWMQTIPPEDRPIDLKLAALVTSGIVLVGLGMIWTSDFADKIDVQT